MLHFCFFLLDPKYYQNEIWSNIRVSYNKHFKHVSGSMWRLETSPRPFMILMKLQYNEICQILVVDIYDFYFSFIHTFKKMKH